MPSLQLRALSTRLFPQAGISSPAVPPNHNHGASCNARGCRRSSSHGSLAVRRRRRRARRFPSRDACRRGRENVVGSCCCRARSSSGRAAAAATTSCRLLLQHPLRCRGRSTNSSYRSSGFSDRSSGSRNSCTSCSSCFCRACRSSYCWHPAVPLCRSLLAAGQTHDAAAVWHRAFTAGPTTSTWERHTVDISLSSTALTQWNMQPPQTPRDPRKWRVQPQSCRWWWPCAFAWLRWRHRSLLFFQRPREI